MSAVSIIINKVLRLRVGQLIIVALSASEERGIGGIWKLTSVALIVMDHWLLDTIFDRRGG